MWEITTLRFTLSAWLCATQFYSNSAISSKKYQKSLSQAKANDIDELALLNSLNFNEFAITSYICVEIPIIQSKGFLSSAAVPRFALHIYKDIVGTKSIFSTFSSNRVLSINKLLLANEAVRYLDYSEVTQQKVLCYSNMSVTHVGEKQYSMETIVLAFEYFASSRTVHNRLREDIQLPSLRTLTWLTSKVRGLVDNVYANNIFLNLLTFFLLASCCYMKFMSLWLYSTTVVSIW